jgi:hypothetical protein
VRHVREVTEVRHYFRVPTVSQFDSQTPTLETSKFVQSESPYPKLQVQPQLSPNLLVHQYSCCIHRISNTSYGIDRCFLSSVTWPSIIP